MLVLWTDPYKNPVARAFSFFLGATDDTSPDWKDRCYIRLEESRVIIRESPKKHPMEIMPYHEAQAYKSRKERRERP